MNVVSFEVLFLTTTFLVPGYVIQSTLSALVPRRTVLSQVVFLRFLTLSSLHNAPWAAYLYWRFGDGFTSRERLVASAEGHAFWVGGGWLAIVLLSPFVATLSFANLRRARWTHRAWRFLGAQPMDPAASAWDFGIHRGWHNLYVSVKLSDGSTVYGKFGSGSHFGSHESDGGIHIEETLELDDSGNWITIPNAPAITIPGPSIQTVEFWGDPIDRY